MGLTNSIKLTKCCSAHQCYAAALLSLFGCHQVLNPCSDIAAIMGEIANIPSPCKNNVEGVLNKNELTYFNALLLATGVQRPIFSSGTLTFLCFFLRQVQLWWVCGTKRRAVLLCMLCKPQPGGNAHTNVLNPLPTVCSALQGGARACNNQV
jgi:hypothetical protein